MWSLWQIEQNWSVLGLRPMRVSHLGEVTRRAQKLAGGPLVVESTSPRAADCVRKQNGADLPRKPQQQPQKLKQQQQQLPKQLPKHQHHTEDAKRNAAKPVNIPLRAKSPTPLCTKRAKSPPPLSRSGPILSPRGTEGQGRHRRRVSPSPSSSPSDVGTIASPRGEGPRKHSLAGLHSSVRKGIISKSKFITKNARQRERDARAASAPDALAGVDTEALMSCVENKIQENSLQR